MSGRPRTSVNAGKPPVVTKNGARICDWYDVGRQLHTSKTTGTELFAALHKTTGELVLIKASERTRLGRNYAQPVQLYGKLQHPHICQQLEVFDSAHFVMVCEMIEGMPLNEYMATNGLAPNESQQVIHQLCAALAYTHGEGVCHRDLCLENVMLAAGPRCNVKLIDFANAGPTARALTRKMPMTCGLFAAPEMLGDTVEYHGTQTDVWALGVLVHVLMTGKFPFTTEASMREGKLEHLGDDIEPEVKELISQLLTVDPAARPSMSFVCKHPWVVRGGDSLGSTLASKTWDEPEVADNVLKECSAMGLDPKAVSLDVKEKAHTELSTTYFLLAQRLAKAQTASATLMADSAAEDGRSATAPAAPGDLGNKGDLSARELSSATEGPGEAVCPSA